MRVVRGVSLTKARAAACAAARRVGLTSSARMLPETSIARMTMSCCEGRLITVAGRATASSMPTMASRKSSGGTWRRRLRPGSAAFRIERLA
jgi:hypothetical protein